MRLLILISFIGAIQCHTVNTRHEDIVQKALEEASKAFELEEAPSLARSVEFPRRMGSKWTPHSEKLAKRSNIQLRAINSIVEKAESEYSKRTEFIYRGTMKRSEVLEIMGRQSVPPECQQPPLNCNFNVKWRTFDGTCNNQVNPRWGAMNTPLLRLLPNAYEDQFDIPRGGRANSKLPNPRTISLNIHTEIRLADEQFTNMLPQFGQFLTHDTSFVPENSHRCCNGQFSSDCWPISILRNDSFFSTVSNPQTCMDFTRSTSFCFPTTSGAREQINSNTAFIDASTVYGNDNSRAQLLRFNGGSRGNRGRLRTNRNVRNFLPFNTEVSPNPGLLGSFVGGDDRVNENPGLAVLHGLFLMEHNRIASIIQSRRSSWSDDSIFQEARRIVIAEYTNIVYGEYLRIILGDNIMDHYNLTLKNEFSTYIPNLEPTILNEFTTAAHRFGHSMVNGRINLVNQGNHFGNYNLRDNYFIANQITQSNGQGFEWIIGGFLKQNSKSENPGMSEDLTNFLFKEPKFDFGFDLAARNIQRCRDHGIPSYNELRKSCSLEPITSWDTKPSEIRDEFWEKLKSTYSHPDDIDPFTGGLTEIPMAGAITGPTFTCIMANQFFRLKFGDRFFFTHENQAGTFTPFQIMELRKVTLSDIICQNTQQTFTTKDVFRVPSPENPWISCRDPSRSNLNINLFI